MEGKKKQAEVLKSLESANQQHAKSIKVLFPVNQQNDEIRNELHKTKIIEKQKIWEDLFLKTSHRKDAKNWILKNQINRIF